MMTGLQRKWRDLSLPKKMHFLFLVLSVLTAVELFALYISLDTLTAVRALVTGESSWSKAQKDAVNSLQAYIVTENQTDYDGFKQFLLVPLGCRIVRLEVLKDNPDEALLFRGFIQGNTHPDDIGPITRLLQRFYWDPEIQASLKVWEAADLTIEHLITIGEGIYQKIQNGGFAESEMREQVSRLEAINKDLTQKQIQFSNHLGNGSRKMEKILLFALFSLLLTVGLIAFILIYKFGKVLSESLLDLGKVAQDIGHGNLERRAPVKSMDELGRLATSINTMATEIQSNINRRVHAEHLNRVKNLFLANVSHEIRTPLGSMMGFARLLEDRGLSEDDRMNYAQIIQRAGLTLSSIVNDILDISKIESGRLKILKQRFSLHSLLEDIQRLFQVRSREKGIDFVFEIDKNLPEFISSDPVRLRQILHNLLENSMKFTSKGHVCLRVFRKGAQIYFDVEDTGVGIAEKNKDLIFEPFEQGDASDTRKYGGTGLGLSISHHLTELLGGSLELMSSEVNKGSHFQASIAFDPAPQAEDHTEAPSLIEAHGLQGLKVLVVDDSEDNRRLLHLMLKKQGVVVDIASDGLEAVNKTISNEYDLIIMDLQMPVLSGIEAIKQMRAMDLKIPIIALTARTLPEDAKECFDAGFNEFLMKPISDKKLFKTLQQFS